MRAALLLGILLLQPAAMAQEHGHDNENGMSMVLFDGPADGRALRGGYTHFGFALMDKDGAPVVHQNAEFNVVQAGKVLFSTTDTHEYDGLFSFDVRFTSVGPYQVTATSGDMALGVFQGEVVEPVDPVEAQVAFEAVPDGPASRVFDITIAVNDANGAIVPHSDAIVEFREAGSGALFSRSHLHIHDAPIAFKQGFGAATDYVATVIGYLAFPSADDAEVPAVVAEFPLSVGFLSAPAPTAPPLAPPAALEQKGAVASGEGMTLYAMYDPNNQVGVGQTARLAALVVDDNLTPLAHVDFSFALTGPRGMVFQSDSLHEYDGMFEFLFTPDVPGHYAGVLTANEGQGVTVPFDLLVIPPAIPLLGGTGTIELGVEGVDDIVAGVEKNLTFRAMGPAGPAMHSEVDVTIFHDGEPPLYNFKLHTHESGLTNAVVVFPHEGDWKIRIDGLPTVPEASVYAPALVEFAVAPGTPADGGVSGVDIDGARASVPVAWTIAIAALALAGFLRRTR